MVQLLKWRLGWIRNANFTYLINKKLGEIFKNDDTESGFRSFNCLSLIFNDNCQNKYTYLSFFTYICQDRTVKKGGCLFFSIINDKKIIQYNQKNALL